MMEAALYLTQGFRLETIREAALRLIEQIRVGDNIGAELADWCRIICKEREPKMPALPVGEFVAGMPAEVRAKFDELFAKMTDHGDEDLNDKVVRKWRRRKPRTPMSAREQRQRTVQALRMLRDA